MPVGTTTWGRSLRGLGLAAAAAVCGLALLSGTAAAQYKETPQGKRGAAKIIRIDEKGRFDRCAAHLDSPAGPARIAWNRDHAYYISTPAVPVNGMLLLRLLETPNGVQSLDAITNGQRVSARVDMQTIESVLKIRNRLVLGVGNKRFEYALGGATMEDIIVDVENCTHRAMGRR